MKRNYFILAILFTCSYTAAYNQSYVLNEKDSKLTIEGTSSLHDWEIIAEELEGKAILQIEQGAILDISDLIFQVEVNGLKSGKGLMDSKTYNALNKDAHPSITFVMKEFFGIENGESGETIVNTKGELNIAGTSKEVNAHANVKINENDIEFFGEVNLDMTMFGVKPPTALMGSIKTGKDVKVLFNIKYELINKQNK